MPMHSQPLSSQLSTRGQNRGGTRELRGDGVTFAQAIRCEHAPDILMRGVLSSRTSRLEGGTLLLPALETANHHRAGAPIAIYLRKGGEIHGRNRVLREM